MFTSIQLLPLQIADILRLPTHISMADGSLDALIEGFLNIDNNKLGTFTFDELCAHMGIQPREEESEGGDESEGSSEYEDDDEEELEEEAAESRPHPVEQ
jgi:hypothetical protein